MHARTKEPVSYTHLDVYKRQPLGRPTFIISTPLTLILINFN